MKSKFGFFLCCATISIGTAFGAKTLAPETVHYTVKLQSSAFGNTGIREMWIKGDKMRWQGKSEKLPINVIKNKNGTFLIHPWKKIAAKYPAGSSRSNPRAIFPGPTGPINVFLKSMKAEKTGTEAVNKQKCNVYGYIDPISRRQCKIWVDAKSEKPIKLYLKGKPGKVDTITATYTKYEVGMSISDSLFEIPKGYVIKPMPSERTKAVAGTTKKKESGV